MKYLAQFALALAVASTSTRAATVAHYEFDGSGTAAVGTTITDSTGNHPGSVAGGDLVYGLDPLFGSYLSFSADANGANTGNRVVIPGAPALTFTVDQDYTIEIIFRTTQVTVNGVLLSKGSDVSNPDSQWWLRHNGAGRAQGLVEGVGNATEDSATSGASTALVNDGKWHHVALVFRGAATPKRLDLYVDGILAASDTSIGTLGMIGGVDSDAVLIGEFASGAANRSFAGDIAAVRFSDAALATSEFLPLGLTQITEIVPADKSMFVAPSTVAGFKVLSPSIGVPQNNIQVSLSGSDVTPQLAFAGTDAQRTVTLPALSANQLYQMNISVTDYSNNIVTRSVSFNTFYENLLFVEAEDYNFESGQFIDNPPLSSTPGATSYLDRFGVEGVDFHQTNTPTATLYRIGDQVGTAFSTDLPRQAYLDAQVTDPGVADYMTASHANSEWINYTRTFPAATYRPFLRAAKGGTVPMVIALDEVTAGSTSSTQTLAPIGTFRRSPTLGANDFDLIPLTDALGNQVALSLSGVKTLRLTMLSGTAGMNLNYLLFVPVTTTQAPFLASVSPDAGFGNAAFNSSIQATIRNGTATVNTGSIQLWLDGALVAANTVPTASGATVIFSPSALSTNLHTAALVFSDNAAVSYTNTWQFYVANQAVAAVWAFNEQAPGNPVSTAAGAILDSIGNSRNGTAPAAGQLYVPGSFNFGNSPALNFTAGPDRVVVPDPSGNFNFTNSFTFEAVIRTTNTATSAAILAKNGSGDGEGEFWWRAPGAAGGKQRVGLNGYFLNATNVILNDGNWHHVAVVYDQLAGEIRLYADYLLDASLANVIIDRPVGRPGDLQIGGFFATTTSEFIGDIDVIRISHQALAPAQFLQTTVALQPLVKSLSPADAARNVAPRPIIEAELLNRDTAVVLTSLKLFLDGADVTSAATRTALDSGAKITFVPATALATGPHTAKVVFNDTAVPANSWTNSWSFSVIGTVPVLALYQFNEKAPGAETDSTPGAIADSSPAERHLTASGNPLPLYTFGAPNYGNSSALSFTLGDDQLATANTAGLNFTESDSFTLEAVIRTLPGANFVGNIVGRDWGSALPSWWFRLDAGLPRFLISQGAIEPSITGSIPVNDGEWHHVAAVREAVSRKLRVYVDYQLAGEANDTSTLPLTNSQNLVIGAYNNGQRQFEGDIDLVRISGEALDPSWFVPLGGLPSTLQLSTPTLSGGNISFSFPTESGRSYVVEATDNLGTPWGTVETIPGNGSVKTVSYPATAPRRFFQIRVE